MKNSILKTTMALALGTALLTGCGGGSSEGGAGTGTQGNGMQNSSTNSNSKNGVVTYKNLEWQDDGTIEGNRVEYAYRNDYCTGLTTGGHSDWRLPTLSEFKELNEVKDQLDFAWNKENYIYWTADEGRAAGKNYIMMFNLSKGVSILFYVDRLDSYGWSTRCVRGVK